MKPTAAPTRRRPMNEKRSSRIETEEDKEGLTMTKAEFQLATVTCPSCIKKIESALGKTAGVGSAKVLFNSSKVKVEFDGAQTSAAKLGEVIENLGYRVLATKTF